VEARRGWGRPERICATQRIGLLGLPLCLLTPPHIIKVGWPSTRSRLLRFPSPDAAAAAPARFAGVPGGAGVLPCPTGDLPGAPRAGGGLQRWPITAIDH